MNFIITTDKRSIADENISARPICHLMGGREFLETVDGLETARIFIKNQILFFFKCSFQVCLKMFYNFASYTGNAPNLKSICASKQIYVALH